MYYQKIAIFHGLKGKGAMPPLRSMPLRIHKTLEEQRRRIEVKQVPNRKMRQLQIIEQLRFHPACYLPYRLQFHKNTIFNNKICTKGPNRYPAIGNSNPLLPFTDKPLSLKLYDKLC